MFSEILLDHFRNPRNAGELTNATACVEVSNPVCGDVLRLTVKLDGERVQEVRFLCRGCTTAIACGSVLTERMVGVGVASLEKITAQALAESLGGLPEATYHGAQLAEDGINALLAELRKPRSKKDD